MNTDPLAASRATSTYLPWPAAQPPFSLFDFCLISASREWRSVTQPLSERYLQWAAVSVIKVGVVFWSLFCLPYLARSLRFWGAVPMGTSVRQPIVGGFGHWIDVCGRVYGAVCSGRRVILRNIEGRMMFGALAMHYASVVEFPEGQ